MADSNATEMVAVMVDGDRNGNGRQQWQQGWVIVAATATVRISFMDFSMSLT